MTSEPTRALGGFDPRRWVDHWPPGLRQRVHALEKIRPSDATGYSAGWVRLTADMHIGQKVHYRPQPNRPDSILHYSRMRAAIQSGKRGFDDQMIRTAADGRPYWQRWYGSCVDGVLLPRHTIVEQLIALGDPVDAERVMALVDQGSIITIPLADAHQSGEVEYLPHWGRHKNVCVGWMQLEHAAVRFRG